MGFFSNFWNKLFGKNKTENDDVDLDDKIIKVSKEIRELVDALGGINNITAFNNCASKLRYDIKDAKLVNEKKLKEFGAEEIIFFGNKHVQVTFGDKAEEYNLKIQEAETTLRLEVVKKLNIKEEENLLEETEEIGDKEKEPSEDYSIIYSPCPGERIPLNELSDKVFTKLGNGYALRPKRKSGDFKIYSPIGGKVVVAYPTKHAFGIKSPSGVEVLVHIGVDTVKLNGIGFKSTIKQNDKVKRGELLSTMDLKKVNKKGASSDVIIIVTDKNNRNKDLKLLTPIDVQKHNIPWLEILD